MLFNELTNSLDPYALSAIITSPLHLYSTILTLYPFENTPYSIRNDAGVNVYFDALYKCALTANKQRVYICACDVILPFSIQEK